MPKTEDELIDVIDNGPPLDDEDLSHKRFEVLIDEPPPGYDLGEEPPPDIGAEQLARAEKYFHGEVNPNAVVGPGLQQGVRQNLSAAERDEISLHKMQKLSEAPKRNLSNEQIRDHARLRQTRKNALERRVQA